MDSNGTVAAGADEERPIEVSLHLNVEETAGGGNDSGVDVTPAVSCDSSLASGCYDPCKSPLGPFSPTEACDGNGPSSLPCYPITMQSYCNGGSSRPSTPTWRRPKLPSSMSSSFHFETTGSGGGGGNRNSPPLSRTEPKKPDLNTVAKQSKISTVKKLVNTYDMAKSLDRYACTLPRRRRKSKENLTAVSSNTTASSSSASTSTSTSTGTGTSTGTTATPPKTPSLNRAASLRRKHIEQGALAQNAAVSSPSPIKPVLPRATRVPPVVMKTKIYHEVCSQTCLTSEDISNVLLGNVLPAIENRVETSDAEVQVSVI